MKKLIKDFTNFLSEAQLSDYDKDGRVTLYHYAAPREEMLVLDPKYPKSSYSRNEFATASTPRVFFYVDPKQKEHFFSSAALYTVDVPANQVYNLSKDTEGYIEKIRHPVYGLRKGVEWDELLETIREEYDGIYYSTPHMDVVAWFHPIPVSRVPSEEQAQLEGEQRKVEQ
jgi:hypothetical protein